MSAVRNLARGVAVVAADRSQDHSGPISVVLVIGVRLYRDGLGEAFKRVPSFDLIATSSSVAEAPDLVRAHQPDVALLDVDEHDGPSIVRGVRAAQPGVRVVVLGIEERAECVIPLLEAGAAGYVTRESSLDELRNVVRCAAHGETLCSPTVVASLAARLADLAERRRSEQGIFELTVREREIVGLIDEGLSNKQIARQLCIEVPTVKNHVHHILVKLQVERRGAAAAMLRA
jgi:two-component system, NarL family, nitrate/nitrite response regulator NarL